MIEQLLAMGSAAIEPLNVRIVYYSEDEVSVESGAGLRKRRLEVTALPLLRFVESHPSRRREAVASFFRGLAAVALEPRVTRRFARLPFREAAARMYPSLEGPLFGVAAALATNEGAPFGHAAPFGDLHVAYYLEIDSGRRLVNVNDQKRWEIGSDRLKKAALSMLFHHSWELEPHESNAVDGLRYFKRGDGYDGARALILADRFYELSQGGLIFAVPNNDRVLFLEGESPVEQLDGFAAHAVRLFRESPCPVSPALFHFSHGTPTRLERN